tara:strand:- start:38 stop:928 length:891 start_codon:yes stop_codon:yes gene_type:complete
MITKKIITIKELDEVIFFLKKGFQIYNQELDNLEKYLQKSNLQLGFYGFVNYSEEKKIDGAILTPLQCRAHTNSFKKPIINLSTWYMLQKSRGLKSINFAKFFLKELENFYITDYSANKQAYSIFKFFGFKDLISSKICSLFSIIFLVNPLKKGLIKNFSQDEVKKIHKEINSYNLIHDIKFYGFSYKNNSFTFAARKRNSIINLFFGLKIKIPILDIIWCSNPKCLSENWKVFCKTSFLKIFTVGIYCIFNDNDLPTISKFDNLFGIKKIKTRFLTYGSTDQKLINTLGSEVMIF